MSGLRFDHMILISDDIEKTAGSFADAGFTITRRADRETGPSANRLVVFADGSYLEILGFVDAEYGARHRLRSLLDAAGPAWGDWSLLVEDLDARTAAFASAGLAHQASPDYAKTLADGRDWSLRLLQFGRGVGLPELGFLIQDNTPHNLRVPDHATAHANGASGIAGITLLSEGAPQVRAALDLLSGTPGRALDPEAGAAGHWRWQLPSPISGQSGFIDLVVPAHTGPLRERLDLAGPGLHAVSLHALPRADKPAALSSVAGCPLTFL